MQIIFRTQQAHITYTTIASKHNMHYTCYTTQFPTNTTYTTHAVYTTHTVIYNTPACKHNIHYTCYIHYSLIYKLCQPANTIYITRYIHHISLKTQYIYYTSCVHYTLYNIYTIQPVYTARSTDILYKSLLYTQ